MRWSQHNSAAILIGRDTHSSLMSDIGVQASDLTNGPLLNLRLELHVKATH